LNRLVTAAIIIALAFPVYGILWYVADGLHTLPLVMFTLVISVSIGYLFFEALSCRRVRGRMLGIDIRRRIDFKEFSRVFGAIAILPAASIIISKFTLNDAVKPIRLYLFFVLVFLVGWALGTVETSRIYESSSKTEREYKEDIS